MVQTFEEALKLSKKSEPRFEGAFDSTWYQGRAGFGGIVGAAMLGAIEEVLGDESLLLRAVQVTFCAPVLAESFFIDVEVVRRGSSVVNMMARLHQGDVVKSLLVANYGRRRETGVEFSTTKAPEVPAPELVPTVPFSPIFPNFAQHFEMKFCVGEIPYSRAERSYLGGWCRIHEDQHRLDFKRGLALLDIWPPAIYSTLGGPRPSATVSWQVVFTADLPLVESSPEDFYLVTVESTEASSGFAAERGYLYDQSGRSLAHALQSVAIFGGS